MAVEEEEEERDEGADGLKASPSTSESEFLSWSLNLGLLEQKRCSKVKYVSVAEMFWAHYRGRCVSAELHLRGWGVGGVCSG